MLNQIEADALIAMRKIFLNSASISLPPGADLTHELVGEQDREKFLLDIYRGTLRLRKLKFQTRGRIVVVLIRLDIAGSPHTNPDGTRIEGTHLHVYQEGFDDKWAYTLDTQIFTDPSDSTQTFLDFCSYCNIQQVPSFQVGLL